MHPIVRAPGLPKTHVYAVHGLCCLRIASALCLRAFALAGIDNTVLLLTFISVPLPYKSRIASTDTAVHSCAQLCTGAVSDESEGLLKHCTKFGAVTELGGRR